MRAKELEEIWETFEYEAPELDIDLDHDFDFEFRHPHMFFDHGSLKRIVKDELRADGLIEYGREYIVLIGDKQMLINGEKQSRSVFKKYRRLLDSMEDAYIKNEEVSIHIGH